MKKPLIIFTALVALYAVSCAPKKAGKGISKPEKESTVRKNTPLIDETLIGERIIERKDDFNRCFAAEHSNTGGEKIKKVMSLFTLSRDGEVKASGLVSIHPVSREFDACMDSVISSIDFPQTSSDEPVLVFCPVEYRVLKRN
jgi:hypothetical protein